MGAFYMMMILGMQIIQTYFSKKASSMFPTSLNGRAKYMALLFGCSSLLALLLLVGGTQGQFDWLTVALATAAGITLVAVQFCKLLAMQNGTMVITSVFSTAGLIIPCVCGVLFFEETMTVGQWGGIAVFIFASFLLISSAKNIYSSFSWKTIFLLLGVFIANGGTMLCQKALTYVNPEGSVTLFSFFSFAVPAVAFGAYLLIAGEKGGQEKLEKGLYAPAVLLAAAMFVINQLVTMATSYVPTAILFTVPNGANNIFAALMAAVLFKEKLTVRSVLGLVLSIISFVWVRNVL
ncbi:MAG: EamA family transporter [Lachnospiraceae bacterium]|nr:EamA family transporter [Lachnospiraceae bacterium]